MELLRKLFKPIHTPTLLVAAPALLQFMFFFWPIKKKKIEQKIGKLRKLTEMQTENILSWY